MKLYFLLFFFGLSVVVAEDKKLTSSPDKQNTQHADEKMAEITQGEIVGNIFKTALDIFPQSGGTEYESSLDVLHCSHCLLRQAKESEFCHRFCVATVDRSKMIPTGPSGDGVDCDVCLVSVPGGAACAQVCSAGQLGRILARLLTKNVQNLKAARTACVHGKSHEEPLTENPQAATEVDSAPPVTEVIKELAFNHKNSTESTVATTLPSVSR